VTRNQVTTAAELIGAGLVVAAAWLMFLPLGLLVAGLFLLLFGWLGAR
jgi:hypothetical protein